MRPFFEALDFAIEDGVTPRALVVPSTAGIYEWATQWARRAPGLVVIAPCFERATAPTDLISALRNGGARPERVLLFSDQLTSPTDAPVAVQSATGIQFISSIEAILHIRYSYRLRVWNGGAEPLRIQSDTPEGVFRSLLSYFSACEGLGDTWLQRQAQVERSLRHRSALGQRELRYFMSVAYHALRSSPVNDAIPPCLARIEALSRQIAANQKGG